MFGRKEETRIALDPIDKAALYPDDLRAKEDALRRTRRFGIGLSGGGIRSATLSLGFFQGMAAAKDLLSRLDVLSTVSGGGYFGGFYSHLLRRPAAAEHAKDDSAPLAEAVLTNRRSRAIEHLRRNGRYLIPGGTGDAFFAATVALRNWISAVLMIGILALTLLAVLTAARYHAADWVVLRQWLGVAAVWKGRILVSPWFRFALIAIGYVAIPFAWAYWLVRDNRQTLRFWQFCARVFAPVAAVIYGGGMLYGFFLPEDTASAFVDAMGTVAVVAALTLGCWGIFVDRSPEEQRYLHSRNLARTLALVAVILAFATIDTIGQSLAAHWRLIAASAAAIIGAIGAFQGRLLSFASALGSGKGPSVPLSVVALIAAALILGVLLGGLATIPYLVLNAGEVPKLFPVQMEHEAIVRLWYVALVAGALTLAAGIVRPFVNRSSLHAFYEARLRRAYLGASNPARHAGGDDRLPDSEPHPYDSLSWGEMMVPKDHIGPIHLLNVTINETIDGRTQTQQMDRRGMPMAIGPAGVSVSRTHHALWTSVAPGVPDRAMAKAPAGAEPALPQPSGFRVFPERTFPEVLNPGQWIAISGGAVSTGLGARTSLGFSLILGLFNVRLGYWWRSGTDAGARHGKTSRTWLQTLMSAGQRIIPMQTSLLSEWFARFEGPARNEWNLTDGGHFENLGAYELLRRRMRCIVVCDFEQDASYEFSGLSNLVRKARVDLDAEITFLGVQELAAAREAELDDPRRSAEKDPLPPFRPPADSIGTLDSLRRGHRRAESLPPGSPHAARAVNDEDPRATSFAHAALARVTYGACSGEAPAGPRHGWLLYVKSTVTGDESADVLQYHTANPAFPHQSTADQFFDEAQWESYRTLGEHLAERLLGESSDLAAWVRDPTRA